MAERLMADNITEVPTRTVPTGSTRPSTEVTANAALTDQQRLQRAQELLETPLTPAQEKAILEAHEVGKDKPGKAGGDAGVGNYTIRQLGEKIKILQEAGFTKQEWKDLMKSGIAGFLPRGVIDIDPATFLDPNNPSNSTLLSRFTTEVKRRGDAGQADEKYLRSKAGQLSQMYVDGRVEETPALEVLDSLEGWALEAERPPGSSLFEQTLANIANLQDSNNTDPDRLTKLTQEIQNLNELERLANEAGLYEGEKSEVFSNLRIGRIDVSIREKREGSRSRHVADAKARAYQTTLETDAFWNDPRFPQRRLLRAQLGGAVDYFRRASATLADSIVRDPRRAVNSSEDIFADRDYDDVRAEFAGIEGVMAAWNFNWKDGKGNDYTANNFEEMRVGLEQERQERPRFMKHPWYHSIEFFADNMSELGLATRDFVKHAIDNLPRGESKVMMQSLQQEQAAAQSAYADAVLFFEREAKDTVVKWTSSEMNSAFSMSAIGYFQRTGGKGAEGGGFKYFTDSWAEGLRKTATSVNYEDVLTLDEEGMFLYIAEKLCEDDGAFYRFGTKSAILPSADEQKEYLDRRREEIITDAASHRLRSMGEQDLLKTFDANDPYNPLIFIGPRTPDDPYLQVQEVFRKLKARFDEIDNRLGPVGGRSRWDLYVEQEIDKIPIHRAFAQVKVKCDLKDAEDILKGKRFRENRWDIYKREAKAWEDFARLGQADNRVPKAKVKFVHPLARNWRDDQEFFDMYEELDVASMTPVELAAYKKREERAEHLLVLAEDYLRFNMIDVRSGSARISFRKEVTINGHTRQENTVEVYTNVLRDELKEAMALDEGRSPIDKRFKVTHILRKMGYQPEMPAYGMFTLGADDTIRNRSIVKHFQEEPEFRDLFLEVRKTKKASDQEVTDYVASLKQRGMRDVEIEADQTLRDMKRLKKYVDDRLFRGSNAKTIIVRFVEDERIAVQAVQRAIRHPDNKKYGNNGGDYENFPGNDNEFEEGGVKYWKNHLYPDYGTSRGTVRINGLIPFINFGVLDRISELGGWTPKYITGLRHRGDEIELAEEGSLLIDPKDTQDYLSRLESILKKRSLWTSAGDAEKKPGILMGGVFSGMFKLRELGTRTDFFSTSFVREISKGGLPKVIENPEMALSPLHLKESGKRAFLETMGSIVEPLAATMRANRELETGYGYAQGTSKDMNTFLMNDIFYWMDNYWNEYQGDYGYAVDGMLHMSRELMYVYLKEEGLIWPEKQILDNSKEPNATDIDGWKNISERLIKDLPEDLWNGVPLGLAMYPKEGSIKVAKDSRYAEAPTKLSQRDTMLNQLRAEIRNRQI